jgi:cold shock CspA family protein
MLYGKIVSWNDSLGYGFIKPDNENQQVFVHISAFGRLFKRPEIGDRVHFDTIIEPSGKQKAKIARIIENEVSVNDDKKPQSVKKMYNKSVNDYAQNPKRGKNKVVLVLFGLIVCAILLVKTTLSSKTVQPVVDKTIRTPDTTIKPRFKCEGKTHCNQMSSYEEALFYMRNCPGTQMDGDHDGIPCEQQFNR